MYPTPYEKVRLGALAELGKAFPDAVLGLSDHSLGNYTCYGAVALGANIVEKHFTGDKNWPGPDIEISMDAAELRELIIGTKAIHLALGGKKTVLPEEQPTIAFAYACVVTTKDVPAGEQLDAENIWVKRPGTGEIKAVHYSELLGRRVKKPLPRNSQLKWADLL
jgi:N-acetylneuraminate synthase